MSFTGFAVRKIYDLDVNQTNTDLGTIKIPPRARLIRVTPYGATVDMTLLLATLGLYDAAGGGGNTLVTPVLLTGLTSAVKAPDLTVLFNDVITTGNIVARAVAAAGSAARIHLAVTYINLA